MANRPGHLSLSQRADVGSFVLGMREVGTPWKLIERKVGLSSAQLRRYLGDLMQHQISPMQHRGSCEVTQ